MTEIDPKTAATLDALRYSLNTARFITTSLLEPLAEHAMVRPTPGGKAGDGNHAIWVLGHLVVSEAGLRGLATGEPSARSDWEPLFAGGSTPTDDASAYPSFDELRAAYDEERDATLSLLDDITGEQLEARPAHMPEGTEQLFSTAAKVLHFIGHHETFHGGELADIRRMVGIKPLA